MAVDIYQVTNFSAGWEPVIKSVHLRNSATTTDLPYLTRTFTPNIFKFGYCTNDNQGMNYPIIILVNGDDQEREIQLGKSGMIEYQPEDWQDVNDPTESEIQLSEEYISQVWVPDGVPFCLDYCYK